MKKLTRSRHFLLLISFTFLLFKSYCQVKVEQYYTNGLSTTIFNTDEGKIIIYLPENTLNENISGTIEIHPTVTSDKKKAKKIVDLYKLSIANQSILLQSKSFGSLSPSSSNNLLQLLNDKGKVVAETHIKSSGDIVTSNISRHIPEYLVANEPAKITYKCDGKLDNNHVTINKVNVPILAESESGVFFRTPQNEMGQSQLQFTNDGETIEATVNILKVDLSVGRTNLLRGESTNLSINVSGLEGLETNVPITILNNSASNITLEGGNVQQLLINPSADATTGKYSKSLSIEALQRGNFSISVKVEPPQPDGAFTKTSELLCNCWLYGHTYLITTSACTELGGNCSDEIENNSLLEVDTSAPKFDFNIPSVITSENHQINLQIRDYDKNDCVAAIFSYRPIITQIWETIGHDNTHLDGLSLLWNIPTNEDGIIEIRAQVVNKNNVVSTKTTQVYLNTKIQFNNESLDVSYTISDDDIKRAEDKARRTGDAIDDLEDEIYDKWGKRKDAEDRKKENEDIQNKLFAIDKVLDSIPKTYKDALKNILDSLASYKKKLPAVIDDSVLQKAIDDAQSRVNDCQDRLEKLNREQQDLEEERDKLKEETDASLEEMDALMNENGMTGGYGYHPDGRYWYGYVGDESSNGDIMYSQKFNQLQRKLRGLKKQYLKTLKRLDDLPNEIAEAEKDCEELNAALATAKTAKENADLHAAVQLEADDICRQIRRLLIPLWQWCIQNPEHCDFRDKIEELMKKCPNDISGFDDFWKDFDDLVNRKKEQEDNFGKAADKDQNDIDDIDDDISSLEDEIKGLEDIKKKEYDAANALREQLAKEAAEAKANADAREKERRDQKKEDNKIKDLIKKAKSDDAGDDAFEDLITGLGLDRLDDATGNLKLGKIIGGLLVIKDMPDCVCPLITALRNAFVAKKQGREGAAIHVEAYLKAWKDCANLPSISSVSIGGTELTNAINNMTKEQTDRAIKALNQAVRVQCE
jgi:uncharacterized coiled-coil DUF342 family protein